jgi:hypothetical protein
VSGNSSTGTDLLSGGGILDEGGAGSLTVLNSTIANNDATTGGGILACSACTSGTANVIASTIAGNTATGTNGDAIHKGGTGGTLTFRTSIVNASNTTHVCASTGGTLASGGYNDEGGTSCPSIGTDIIMGTPNLDLLDNNGGPSIGPPGSTEVLKTREAPSGSDALDHVLPASCTNDTPPALLASDERGVDRPFGANCDVGAYERATCLGTVIDQGAIVGTSGPDNLSGTAAGEMVVSGAGADIVDPGGGSDTVCTGGGGDSLQLTDGVFDNADCGAGSDSVQSDVQGTDQLTGCESVSFALPPPVPTPAPAPAPTTTAPTKKKKCKKKKSKSAAVVAKKCKKKK